MTWLLCYDIEDDKLRQKIAKLLEKTGWERLQKSVFATGVLQTKQFNRFLKILQDRFEPLLKEDDKIYAWCLSDNQFAEVVKMGQPYDAKWIQGSYDVLYIGDEHLLK